MTQFSDGNIILSCFAAQNYFFLRLEEAWIMLYLQTSSRGSGNAGF